MSVGWISVTWFVSIQSVCTISEHTGLRHQNSQTVVYFSLEPLCLESLLDFIGLFFFFKIRSSQTFRKYFTNHSKIPGLFF